MRLSGLKGFTTVNSLLQGCFLPNHLDRILALAEPDKDLLPEPSGHSRSLALDKNDPVGASCAGARTERCASP